LLLLLLLLLLRDLPHLAQLQHYVSEMRRFVQHPFQVLPTVLEEARVHALPGRESAAMNAVHWELAELLRQDVVRPELPTPSRVLPFSHRAGVGSSR
jgi:hypothetical protein